MPNLNALKIDDEIRSRVNRYLTLLDGIKGLITRALKYLPSLRYLLDLIKSAGLKINSAIAAISSAAYPGNFASK